MAGEIGRENRKRTREEDREISPDTKRRRKSKKTIFDINAEELKIIRDALGYGAATVFKNIQDAYSLMLTMDDADARDEVQGVRRKIFNSNNRSLFDVDQLNGVNPALATKLSALLWVFITYKDIQIKNIESDIWNKVQELFFLYPKKKNSKNRCFLKMSAFLMKASEMEMKRFLIGAFMIRTSKDWKNYLSEECIKNEEMLDRLKADQNFCKALLECKLTKKAGPVAKRLVEILGALDKNSNRKDEVISPSTDDEYSASASATPVEFPEADNSETSQLSDIAPSLSDATLLTFFSGYSTYFLPEPQNSKLVVKGEVCLRSPLSKS